ncbi:aminoacyl-tRNA hydrolase [Phenylobacterium sp.]|uniref:aminoacyl-tRNA hydrolase n=1 Tax=Phenylobacterium sp. TaxID=1871053 RepID=UPI00120CE386|nr:aminoacyl-tRNA hydrolase [Phenylobacterium sp.]THD64352.1 MAG: aminoacyl-tRNA hydrolase [Phenylobacterium sp.]
MLLIAGLGNPGPTYAKTRHNIGFMAVDEIARRWGFGPFRSRFSGFAAEGAIETPAGSVKTLILKPQTFYNESGRAVGEALKFFKTEPENLVVFYDEIDLAPGRFRMKAGGGAAGNNGVRSIVSQVGPYFRRARLGTGHPGDKELVHGHVLSEFHKAELKWVEPLIAACADAAPLLAAGEDEKYQTEVMRLAPAEKVDPRKAAREGDRP